MKIKILIVSLLLMTGCTSLTDFINKKTGTGTAVQSQIEGERLVQNNIKLTGNGSKTVLNTVKNNWEKQLISPISVTREMKSVYLYAGETLKISDSKITSVYIVGKKVPSYQLVKKDSSYNFRSLFQNDFTLKISRKGDTVQNLVVKNILNYKVEKGPIYDAARDSYNFKRYQEAISNIDLYTIAYPNDDRENELNVMLFNIFVNTGDNDSAVKKINSIKKVINLSESEITSLFTGELRLLDYNLNLDDYYIYYTKKYDGFSLEVIKYLKTKTVLTEKEYQHLINESSRLNDLDLRKFALEKKAQSIMEENSEIKIVPQQPEQQPQPQQSKQPQQIVDDGAQNISPSDQGMAAVPPVQPTQGIDEAAYKQLVNEPAQENKDMMQLDPGQLDADQKYYEKGKKAFVQNRYTEAIIYFNNVKDKSIKMDTNYYLGSSYFINGDYDKAVESYKKYLASQDDSNARKAESSYNTGSSYEKKGDKESALLWYKNTMDGYPGTTWARKSNIAIVKLKNKK